MAVARYYILALSPVNWLNINNLRNMKSLTALIPACNDAYSLSFCIESIAGHFDEIIVFDDASVDETAQVLQRARKQWPHVQVHVHSGIPVGPIVARNRLLEMAKGDYLFFIDADDVLIEGSAHLLQEIPAIAPLVWLQLAEMWGDFDHTTQRLVHHDPCHLFLDRSLLRDITWGALGAPVQRPTYRVREDYRGVQTMRGPGPLFWHVKGVKPDWRLLGKTRVRPWLAAGRQGDYFDDILLTDPGVNHESAVQRLFVNDTDRIQPYRGWPDRPASLCSGSPRFEIVYEDGKPSDRLDHGWWAGPASQPAPSAVFLDSARLVRADGVEVDGTGADVVEFRSDGGVFGSNMAAAVIWALCDGSRTFEEVARQVKTLYPEEEPGVLRGQVVETLLTLYRKQLLVLQ